MSLEIKRMLNGGEFGIGIIHCSIKCFSVDASPYQYEYTLGRLVNDGIGPEENAKMVIIPIDKTPHLCLFALRDIQEGEEIRYDYGVPNLPWRKKVNMFYNVILTVIL